MKRLIVILFLLPMLLIFTPADADSDDFNRTISVAGEGNAAAPPDMATILTGIITEKNTAIEALEANNEMMAKIMDVLKSHRIAPEDVQTSNINVSPEYKRDEQGRREAEIIGYRVINQVRVDVHNLKDLGKVLDALIRAGSNQVSGVNFAIEDTTNVLNHARKRAITDARNRAEVYAQAAGVRVGKVLAISEQPIELPQPKVFRQSLAAEGVSSVPVATGEQKFQVRIHMVFSLEDT